jgi:hypothetical protein
MATAYLPLLSCTVGARDALIAARILPFNHTHSVLPTWRMIESCDQNLSMALVNQTLPYRTQRLSEYQQSRHRGGAGKRNGRMSASELPVVTDEREHRSGAGCRHRMLEGSADIWPYVSSPCS